MALGRSACALVVQRGRAAVVALVLFAAIGATPAYVFAQSLDQIRAQGVAGERYDGFLAPRGEVSAQVRQLIIDTNAKRREIYRKRAAEQGVEILAVGKIYARQIMQNAPAGTWFLDANNKWLQR